MVAPIFTFFICSTKALFVYFSFLVLLEGPSLEFSTERDWIQYTFNDSLKSYFVYQKPAL